MLSTFKMWLVKITLSKFEPMKHLSTESDSHYDNLEHKSSQEIVAAINKEDATVAAAVENESAPIVNLIDAVYIKMKEGGRLFYIGSGTSGRLGVVDASECPPTYGVPHDWVVGIIAGGDSAIRKAVEFAEDDTEQAWKDLSAYAVDPGDLVIGITASGKTPYVIGGLKPCQAKGIVTGSIACNSDSQVAEFSDFPIEVIVGPEVVTGSTRMKSGTAQKMVLNMISSAVMIKLGRVVGNKMVDMQLSNDKLVDRGTRMVVAQTDLTYEEAQKILLQEGSVRGAINAINNG